MRKASNPRRCRRSGLANQFAVQYRSALGPVSGGVVLARVFEEAGLPAGLLHVLPGGGELGAVEPVNDTALTSRWATTRFSTLDEAVQLASDTEYGLALGIFTADVATGLALAERIPTGTAHINDQTLRDDAHVPFGGVRNSGNSSRFGTAAANIEAYTDTRWITAQPTPPAYPF